MRKLVMRTHVVSYEHTLSDLTQFFKSKKKIKFLKLVPNLCLTKTAVGKGGGRIMLGDYMLRPIRFQCAGA